MYPEIVSRIKELALFRIDLNEKSAGDLMEFKKRITRRNWYEQNNLHQGQRRKLKEINTA